MEFQKDALKDEDWVQTPIKFYDQNECGKVFGFSSLEILSVFLMYLMQLVCNLAVSVLSKSLK